LTQPFKVESDTQAGLLTVSVIGELDQSTAPDLREALAPSLVEPTDPILVDLSNCEFIDSTGLSLLVETKRRLEERRMRFGVCCADADVRRLLELTGIDRALSIYESRDEAVTGLANGLP
jgi:anti-sigma B factor antagonist